jgi:hypothetical protein
VAWPESVGVVCLIDKGVVGLGEFFDSRPETACEGGKNGFVDEPLLAGVVGSVVDCDQVIEGRIFPMWLFRPPLTSSSHGLATRRPSVEQGKDPVLASKSFESYSV